MELLTLIALWLTASVAIYMAIMALRPLPEETPWVPKVPLQQWDAYRMATVTGSRPHQRYGPPEHREAENRKTVVIDHEYLMARLARQTGRWDNIDELLKELGADD